ncbi:MAG TPA: PAS domain-containing protein [Marinagarivorans sp.]
MHISSLLRPWRWFSRSRDERDTDDERLARHTRIFKGANNYGYFDWNLGHDCITWSGGYWAFLGYSLKDVEHIAETRRYFDYVHPDDLDILMTAVRKTLREGGPTEVAYRVRKKLGGWVWTEIHADATRDESGWVHYISGIALDVTKRKYAEQALLLSEARHARIIKSSNDGFWEWSAEQSGFSFSNRCWELLGYTEQDDVVNQGVDRLQAWRKRMHPEDGKMFDAAIDRHIKTKEPFDVEYRIRHRDGSWCWIRGRGHMAFDEKGRPMRMSGTNMCITELKQAEERVLAAKEQAEAANRAKSDFLSSMSHELRTPLNAILGFSQILEGDLKLTSEQRNNVVEIAKAGRYLLTLIGDVLDLAKIEAGRMDVSLESVEPNQLLTECLSYVQSRADELSIQMKLSMEPVTHQRVCADRIRLKQVFLNLLSNAVKYNKPFGRVFVEGTFTENGNLRVEINDTGRGIPEQKASEVFQPFCRLGAEQTDIEGSGVGLVITRQLVNQMGGEIGFYNRSEGGCCFWLELPLMSEEQSVTEPVPIATTENLQLFDCGEKSVLYIEDNDANQRLIQKLFERYKGIDVEIASDAFKGVFAARVGQPDLIILDINLPGMNGYEALEILRADKLTRAIPIIALSANAMSHDRAKGLEAGFNEYLTKPLDMAQLMAALNRLWADDHQRIVDNEEGHTVIEASA